MDLQLKAKWVKALRSGDYQQTDGVLRRGYMDGGGFGYCCLGVLGDVMGAKWDNNTTTLPGGERLDREDEYLLSEKALDLAKLPYDQQRVLSRMNDNGKSFDDIA